MFSFAVARSDVRSILQNLSQALRGSQPVKCTVFPNSNAFARLVTNARCDQRSSQQSSQSRDHRRQPISAQYDPPWPSPHPTSAFQSCVDLHPPTQLKLATTFHWVWHMVVFQKEIPACKTGARPAHSRSPGCRFSHPGAPMVGGRKSEDHHHLNHSANNCGDIQASFFYSTSSSPSLSEADIHTRWEIQD